MKNPVISVAERRVAVYNSGGTSLKILNPKKILFSQEMKNEIIHTSLSKNNCVAVTTKSPNYNGEVVVYNSHMEEVLNWFSAKSFPVQSFLSPRAKKLTVSTVLTENGKLINDIYVIDIKKGEEKFVLRNENGFMLGLEYLSDDDMIVFYTDKAIRVNMKNGQIKKEYSYKGKTLTSYDVKNSNILMTFGGYSNQTESTLILTNLDFTEKFATKSLQRLQKCMIIGQKIYVLGESVVQQYNLKGEKVADIPTKNNIKTILNYNGCVAIYGDEINKVEKIKNNTKK